MPVINGSVFCGGKNGWKDSSNGMIAGSFEITGSVLFIVKNRWTFQRSAENLGSESPKFQASGIHWILILVCFILALHFAKALGII